jgi:hypothetical protein
MQRISAIAVRKKNPADEKYPRGETGLKFVLINYPNFAEPCILNRRPCYLQLSKIYLLLIFEMLISPTTYNSQRMGQTFKIHFFILSVRSSIPFLKTLSSIILPLTASNNIKYSVIG